MERDEDILDLNSRRTTPPEGADAVEPSEGGAAVGRAWISVYFECCRVYARIYKNRAGTAYVGWCPKCARKATVRVGPGGTTTRFFLAR